MSVSLTSNFFLNARGLTLEDGGGITWSLNPNTNAVTANASGAGATGASPTAKVGLVAVNGSAGTWMRSDAAPPIDQAIVPVWTGLHTFNGGLTLTGTLTISTHTLSLTANASIAGTNTGDQVIPAGANPIGSVGLTVVNGSASTYMRSDAAPLLSQSITPTWLGSHAFSPSSGVAVAVTAASGSRGLTVSGSSGNYASFIKGIGSAGNNLGLLIEAGTNSSDAAIAVLNSTGTITFFEVLGDGSGTLGPTATSGLSWTAAGAMKMSSTFAINGGTPTAQLTGFGSPSGSPTSGLTSSSTLAQTAGTLAALLAYLKTIGFVGA